MSYLKFEILKGLQRTCSLLWCPLMISADKLSTSNPCFVFERTAGHSGKPLLLQMTICYACNGICFSTPKLSISLANSESFASLSWV